LNRPGNSRSIAFGQTLADSIGEAAETDTYTFRAASGDKVMIRMSATSGNLYPGVSVYSPNGAKLCSASGNPSFGAEIASCDLPGNGPYTILAYDRSSGARTGDYSLSIQKLNRP